MPTNTLANTKQGQVVQSTKKFSEQIQDIKYKNLVNNTLGDPQVATRFVANISTVVAMNPSLQDCSPASILSAGLLAEVLHLNLNSSLGRAYIVPFNSKKKNADGTWSNVKVAQFQIGWKGYVEMMLRGNTPFISINAMEVREGEYLGRDSDTGEPVFKFITNDDERSSSPIIGYMAIYKLKSGFTKKVYMTKSQMKKHAETYSQAYKNDLKYGTKNSFWAKDDESFDEMAKKTMIRVIAKWCPLSSDVSYALEKDMTSSNDGKNYEYVDNSNEEIEFEDSRYATPSDDAIDVEDLKN